MKLVYVHSVSLNKCANSGFFNILNDINFRKGISSLFHIFILATYAMQTTFICRLWKLQSEPSDQHPRSMGDGIILQSEPVFGLGNHTFANPSFHTPALLLLDVDSMVQIGVSIVCIRMWFA